MSLQSYLNESCHVRDVYYMPTVSDGDIVEDEDGVSGQWNLSRVILASIWRYH